MTMSSASGGSMPFLGMKNEKAQKLLAWIALAAAGFGVYVWILPFVLAIASLTLKLIVMGAGIWLLLMFLLNPRFRWAIGFLVQRSINALVSGIISQDPIGVMKSYLREVKENIVTLSERLAEVRGALRKSHEDLAQYTQEKERSEGILQAAKSRNLQNAPATRTEANKILRREASIERIKKEIQQGEALVDLLSRYLAKAEAYRDDLDDNITFTARERKRLKTSTAAFSAAKRILKGETLGAELYDEALETAREQAAMMVGDIQQFVDQSKGIMQSFELEQDGAVEQVLARLEQQGRESLLLEYQPGAAIDVQVSAVPEPAPIERFLRNG